MGSLTLQRGDIVICVLKGDYGKPRPAAVVQSDLFNPTHASVTLCPLTSHCIEAPLFRLPVDATPESGLDRGSQIMVDKIVSVKVAKIREKVGELTPIQLERLDEALKRWLSLP